ncbi:SugE family quaternary ammonium compound efflux SMR transporter [Cognatishimia sp. WU-CL00825]|uniref:DMT family transporter n=1 Tax=Cognatishimia sp. WU-CL00825 TaxID=3127658 RepID=UPI003104FE65
MAWILLLIAGVLEVSWAAGLKAAAGKPNVFTIGITGVLMLGSLVALAAAMRSLPLGVAYPIWTGIGSVGAVGVGVAVYKDQLDATTIAGVVFLCIGMALIGVKSH